MMFVCPMVTTPDIVRMVLLTTTLIAACCAQPTRTKYCGVHLAEALQLACGNDGYNAPFWADDETGTRSTNRNRRIKTISLGVATECCHIGCSWRTINSYCAEPHKQKPMKSSGESSHASSSVLPRVGEEPVRDELAAAARTVDVENIQRSAPLFGTVSPEYLRLPWTLDEVPTHYGMQGY